MKTRCLELDMSNEEYQKKYEQLDEDRADIIAYLKRMLQEKEDEIMEMKERLEGLVKTLDEERSTHMEKTGNLEHEFKVMHEQLTSEIKLLTGKLNSLEEFRLQRDDLLKKFKVQEQDMAEQELRHKQTLYEVERKFIIGKDKLKKEMEAKLLQLSIDFQDATRVRIAATTHRTVRENIAVNNELQKMLETQRNLRKENKIMKERDRKLSLEVKLCEEGRDIVLAKNMAQHKLINRLTMEYDDMARNIGELQNSAQHAVELERQTRDMTRLLDEAMKQITLLEENQQATEQEKNETLSKLLQSNMETFRLQNILHAAVKSVKEALKVQTQPSSDEALNLSHRENLLGNLLQLLNTSDLSEHEKQEKNWIQCIRQVCKGKREGLSSFRRVVC
ncbi:cilia- and flagella-associated protein 157-like isoform X2 [Zootermopsis nevadensis]|uniref:Cilia- and flagella-associated protein 157 n=1 Tax=Zootermopsis nevadensis TaxID=136037 RepID=A0A067R2H4_ZOONE|nr:cilia- and flagella-associated protein 157-like isoform X2 [Zootermopsis nevadensis]KDR17225.1 hypothetical protein L798_08952 [Zootermopsis nevadensis]